MKIYLKCVQKKSEWITLKIAGGFFSYTRVPRIQKMLDVLKYKPLLLHVTRHDPSSVRIRSRHLSSNSTSASR